MANAMRNAVVSILLFCSFLPYYISAAQEIGMASMYSSKFQGSRTASGEVFSHGQMTAAHRTLPFNTLVKITRTDNGKFVIVKINDRGPFVSNRLTDISQAAATKLGFNNEGDEIRVKLEVISERSVPLSNPNNTIPKRSDTPLSMERPSMSEKTEYVGSKSGDNLIVPREYRYAPSRKNASPSNTVAQKKNAIQNVTSASNATPKGGEAVGLYIHTPKRKGYAVQVASMANQDNMKRKVQEVKSDTAFPVFVHIAKSAKGSSDFKIMLGPYDNKASADSCLKTIQKKKIDGFVVNISNLK
jgi:rare lipoprotein A (peptidoglycan hydrolase)